MGCNKDMGNLSLVDFPQSPWPGLAPYLSVLICNYMCLLFQDSHNL